MSDNKAQRARDTLATILSFYAKHSTILENVPSVLYSTSPTITVAVNAPSVEECEILKKQLREMLNNPEVIDGLSDLDRRMMLEAATSVVRLQS